MLKKSWVGPPLTETVGLWRQILVLLDDLSVLDGIVVPQFGHKLVVVKKTPLVLLYLQHDKTFHCEIVSNIKIF